VLARGCRKTAGPITNNAAKVGRVKVCVSIYTFKNINSLPLY
jgi:hypothetical protein